jgi:soluble lytic murein transglycosylase
MVKHLISTTALFLPAALMAASPQEQKIIWQSGVGNGNITVPTPLVDPSNGSIPAALQRWRVLNGSGNYSFSEYASFLMTYPDWPGTANMRKNAEQAIDLNSYSSNQVVAYFDRLPPLTNTGRAKYAIALGAVGDNARAESWARRAWREGSLTDDDEARISGMMTGKLTENDHDTRVDKLLWINATRAAEKTMPYTSAARRAGFAARIALMQGSGNADGYISAYGNAANCTRIAGKPR